MYEHYQEKWITHMREVNFTDLQDKNKADSCLLTFFYKIEYYLCPKHTLCYLQLCKFMVYH